jgi:hypothetical protein
MLAVRTDAHAIQDNVHRLIGLLAGFPTKNPICISSLLSLLIFSLSTYYLDFWQKI